MNYHAVLETLKEFGAKGVLVCESPNIEQDALMLQKEFENCNRFFMGARKIRGREFYGNGQSDWGRKISNIVDFAWIIP